MSLPAEPATTNPLRERRRRAARSHGLRVSLLVVLTGGIVYAGWFAPWSKPRARIPIEAAR